MASGKEPVRSPFAFLGRWEGLAVAALYGFVSLSITFFNKAVFSMYAFNYSNALTAAQMVLSLVLLWLLRRFGYVQYPDFDRNTARIVFPLVFFFIGMVVTGLAALQFVNVPMYSALRRFTTWIVMVGEQTIMRKVFPADEQLSVYLMIIGALVAGWGDLTFHLLGYVLVALNCIVTALYLVFIPKKTQESGLNTFGLMFYNNLMSLPFVLIIVYFLEWEQLLSYPFWTDYGFHFVFWMSAVQAFILNYSIFLCSTVNSPLTTSITGQAKNLLQTTLGLVAFGDVIFTWSLSWGLAVSTAASMWYGWIKYKQSSARRPPEKETKRDVEQGSTPTAK